MEKKTNILNFFCCKYQHILLDFIKTYHYGRRQLLSKYILQKKILQTTPLKQIHQNNYLMDIELNILVITTLLADTHVKWFSFSVRK